MIDYVQKILKKTTSFEFLTPKNAKKNDSNTEIFSIGQKNFDIETLKSDTFLVIFTEKEQNTKIISKAFADNEKIFVATLPFEIPSEKILEKFESVEFKEKPMIFLIYDFESVGNTRELKLLEEFNKRGYSAKFDFLPKKLLDILIDDGIKEGVFVEVIKLYDKNF